MLGTCSRHQGEMPLAPEELQPCLQLAALGSLDQQDHLGCSSEKLCLNVGLTLACKPFLLERCPEQHRLAWLVMQVVLCSHPRMMLSMLLHQGLASAVSGLSFLKLAQ